MRTSSERDRWLAQRFAQERKDAFKTMVLFSIIAAGTVLFWFLTVRAILKIIDPVDPPAATPTTHEQT